ncbi:hypothetical protein [Terracoccus sp. 273MFTsu3.1]|uniref:hypothetical protein n=1 Tax=Terracoccus sp. 273MFTsu3.1 TaxID=1172188 RepID=UPI0012DF6EA0|nr:hypothetical protein [Terracoccus sp. 273MFTsu3.1]
MDARVITWYLGPVVLLALVVNLARWLGARRLDAFAARARRRAALGSVVGALLAYAVAQAGVDGAAASPSGEGATAHPAVPALAAVAGILVAAVAERWAPRRSTPGPRREAALDIRRGTESVRLTGYVVAGLVLCAVGLLVGWLTSAPGGRLGMREWEGVVVTTTSAYPGRDYTLGTIGALVLLVVATWLALRVADARPAYVDDPDLDRALRLGARVRVLRWSAAGSLVTAAGLCLTIGPQLNDVTQRLRGAVSGADLPPAPVAPTDWTQDVAFALTFLGFVALVVALFCLLWDAPAVPSSRAAKQPAASTVSSSGGGSR